MFQLILILDCAPGRSNQVSLLIDREGTFYGQCSEICGLNAPKLNFIKLYCMLKNWIKNW